MAEKERLQEMHAQLRKARYFYYEKSESIMTDFEYDMLEKEYSTLAEKLKTGKEKLITNFIGFNIAIPMNLYSLDEI